MARENAAGIIRANQWLVVATEALERSQVDGLSLGGLVLFLAQPSRWPMSVTGDSRAQCPLTCYWHALMCFQKEVGYRLMGEK